MKKQDEDIRKLEQIFDDALARVNKISDEDFSFLYSDESVYASAVDLVRAAALKAEHEYRQRDHVVPPHVASALVSRLPGGLVEEHLSPTPAPIFEGPGNSQKIEIQNLGEQGSLSTTPELVRGLNIFIDDDPQPLGARIKVIGIGGGGSNAVNRMIEAGIEGIEFIVANTDLQALKRSKAPIKIQLGSRLTKGLGAGANPNVGREAALEDTDKIIEVLEGADMVFVTTGLGGGTGTGGAPIIASLATELGALTVAVVTKPFHFEGRRRMQQAEQGLRELRECVDTVITIPNERLLHTVEKHSSLAESFGVADDVLRQAVQGISDLITVPGLINLDFADVKSIIEGMGIALMGAGRGRGENRGSKPPNRRSRRRCSRKLLFRVRREC